MENAAVSGMTSWVGRLSSRPEDSNQWGSAKRLSSGSLFSGNGGVQWYGRLAPEDEAVAVVPAVRRPGTLNKP